MNKTDLAYIAGIIDGEGSIHTESAVSKVEGLKRYNIVIAIGMTERSSLEIVRGLFGGKIYHYPQKGKRKDVWKWQIKGQKAEVMVKAIKPYLLVKRTQAEIALRLLSIHPRGKHYTPMERFLQEIDARAIKGLNK